MCLGTLCNLSTVILSTRLSVEDESGGVIFCFYIAAQTRESHPCESDRRSTPSTLCLHFENGVNRILSNAKLECVCLFEWLWRKGNPPPLSGSSPGPVGPPPPSLLPPNRTRLTHRPLCKLNCQKKSALYCMVLRGIPQYCMVLNSIMLYFMAPSWITIEVTLSY